jgi:phosphonate transport system permease protein
MKKKAAAAYREPLFDRLFKPEIITLPNGHTVKRPRSRMPLITIVLIAVVWASIQLTGFDIAIIIKSLHIKYAIS